MTYAKKSLGQHFLMHPQTAARIVAAARITHDDTVLEIGPGRGMLTRALLQKARQVVAIETDSALVRELHKTFAEDIENGRLILVHGDILNFNPTAHHSLPTQYSVVANIPYYLTGEILRQFLSGTHKPMSMTLLVQKEVAKRITLHGPAARKKKESLLSLSVKAYGTPRYEFAVPRGAFIPAPKVDSAVISITDINQDAFQSSEEEGRFFRILRAGFSHPRKKLAGNLKSIAPAGKLSAAFGATDIPPDARPEDVLLPSWRMLARGLV